MSLKGVLDLLSSLLLVRFHSHIPPTKLKIGFAYEPETKLYPLCNKPENSSSGKVGPEGIFIVVDEVKDRFGNRWCCILHKYGVGYMPVFYDGGLFYKQIG